MIEVKAASWVDRIYNRWYYDKYSCHPLYGITIEQFLPTEPLRASIILFVIFWLVLHIAMGVLAIILVANNLDKWFPKTDAALERTVYKTVNKMEKKFSAVTSAFDFVGDILRLFAAKARAAHENICPVIRRGVD